MGCEACCGVRAFFWVLRTEKERIRALDFFVLKGSIILGKVWPNTVKCH